MAAQAPPNIDPNSAVYATDEYGRPFIIVREGQRKSRLSGIEAIRVSSKEKKQRVHLLVNTGPIWSHPSPIESLTWCNPVVTIRVARY